MSSTCRNEINYSQITGDRILPFLFSLNLEESILYPEHGPNQSFCYENVENDQNAFVQIGRFSLFNSTQLKSAVNRINNSSVY